MSSVWQWFFGAAPAFWCETVKKDNYLLIQFWQGDRQICHVELKNKPVRFGALCKALASGEDFEYYNEEPINGSRQFGLVGKDIKIGLENYQGYKSTQGCVGFALDRALWAPLLLAKLQQQ